MNNMSLIDTNSFIVLILLSDNPLQLYVVTRNVASMSCAIGAVTIIFIFEFVLFYTCGLQFLGAKSRQLSLLTGHYQLQLP